MLCVPLFGDQPFSAKKIEVLSFPPQTVNVSLKYFLSLNHTGNSLCIYQLQAKGFGLSFRLMHYTEGELLEKIDKIVSDPSYRYSTSLCSVPSKSLNCN